MARNALQIGADDGNPLSAAPWGVGDPTDPVSLAGAQNAAGVVDKLGQWLAAMRAKTEATRPIWNPNNPVGTETLQSVGMPRPTTYAGTIGQFVDPRTGQLTTQGQARMEDNPALGFDTGGLGAAISPRLVAPAIRLSVEGRPTVFSGKIGELHEDVTGRVSKSLGDDYYKGNLERGFVDTTNGRFMTREQTAKAIGGEATGEQDAYELRRMQHPDGPAAFDADAYLTANGQDRSKTLAMLDRDAAALEAKIAKDVPDSPAYQVRRKALDRLRALRPLVMQ